MAPAPLAQWLPVFWIHDLTGDLGVSSPNETKNGKPTVENGERGGEAGPLLIVSGAAARQIRDRTSPQLPSTATGLRDVDLDKGSIKMDGESPAISPTDCLPLSFLPFPSFFPPQCPSRRPRLTCLPFRSIPISITIHTLRKPRGAVHPTHLI